jgi:predicted phosphoribosyltransferase
MVARHQGAARVVLAVPVAPHDWTARLGEAADTYLTLHAPHAFGSVGQFYADFDQTTDDEVIACLLASSAVAGADPFPASHRPDPHQGARP